MKIGIVGNFKKPEAYEIFNALGDFLSSQNIPFFLLENQDINLTEINYSQLTRDIIYLKNNCDIIISIGGDGTIISSIRKFVNCSKPILGLHIGGLGFLAECNISNYKKRISDILSNKFYIENRMLLKVKSDDVILHIINELVIDRRDSGRTIKINLEISGEYANTYESDGLIFSTPTGSTAYSLSAGGPIIHPCLNLISVTPICPHTLSMRPLIISSEEMIKVTFEKSLFNKKISLTADGQKQEVINHDSEVIISKSNHIAKIIKFQDEGYYSTLRNKMNWKGNLRYK